MAEEDNELLYTVVEQYEHILTGAKELESQRALHNEEDTAKQNHQAQLKQQLNQMESVKDQIRQKLGPQLFDELYKFLVYHRS